MDWAEYLQAKQDLKIGDNPPLLFMSGVVGDNSTRYLMDQKGKEFRNDQTLLTNPGLHGKDFVWNGRNVRAHFGFSSGGHPALAGFDSIYCAGRIKPGYFYFHSGHYHPKQINALYFFADFIENTCASLHGGARDNKVDELSQITLRLYEDDSETDTYRTTFAEIVEGLTTPRITITKSPTSTAPIKIGKPSVTKSQPMLITSCKDSIDRGGMSPSLLHSHVDTVDTEGSTFEDLGINTYGRHQLKVRINGAPPWIHDSARTRCKECDKEFGFIRRKHHCRRCGDIVCGDCSGHTKNVRYPAVDPSAKTPEKQPVRVCNTCFYSVDLI